MVLMERRVHLVNDSARGPVRAYSAAEAARSLGVTPKTVAAWCQPSGGLPPRLLGWAPRTADNPGNAWLVEAEAVDMQLASATDALTAERAQLAEERQMLTLERQVFERDRLKQLETRNAELEDELERLTRDNAQLRAKLGALGQVVQQLTTDAR